MKTKLALTGLIIAALAGSTFAADAKGKKHAKQSIGTTTGMSKGTGGMTTGAGRGSANPSSQGNVGPGTDNLSGKQPGGR
jgi:hypothetical protein